MKMATLPAMSDRQLTFDFNKPVETAEPTSSESTVLSITQLNQQIKDILEKRFSMVWAKGEISNFKPHSSGHHYFSLKDSQSQISAVMFRGQNSKLKFSLEDGLEVIVRGRLSLYGPRGSYQIVCDLIEPVGAGALQKAYEQLKKKLFAEGLFEASRKKQIPPLPHHIAVVTSPTGAAIRDILNVLGRRYKAARVTVVPTLVQGAEAPKKIAEAIALTNQLKDVDVMIVGRGGGSIEDLWSFNEEVVARAIAASRIPIISAVGHEIDTTISDFVADLRAPTPSAAAELVVKSAGELVEKIEKSQKRLELSTHHFIFIMKQKVMSLSKRLVDPQKHLQELFLKSDDLYERLERARKNRFFRFFTYLQSLQQRLVSPRLKIQALRQTKDHLRSQLISAVLFKLQHDKKELEKQMALLDSLSPLKVVDRGYSIVTQQGMVIKNAGDLKKGEELDILFAKGKARVTVIEIKD